MLADSRHSPCASTMAVLPPKRYWCLQQPLRIERLQSRLDALVVGAAIQAAPFSNGGCQASDQSLLLRIHGVTVEVTPVAFVEGERLRRCDARQRVGAPRNLSKPRVVGQADPFGCPCRCRLAQKPLVLESPTEGVVSREQHKVLHKPQRRHDLQTGPHHHGGFAALDATQGHSGDAGPRGHVFWGLAPALTGQGKSLTERQEQGVLGLREGRGFGWHGYHSNQ